MILIIRTRKMMASRTQEKKHERYNRALLKAIVVGPHKAPPLRVYYGRSNDSDRTNL